ncbi:MAG: hypothetical protein HXJ92_01530, partial [candidate division SR1 bacterium]|nr:hypothetical protein [candidate division SR1 bacterium]
MPENINLPPHNIEAEKGVISGALLDSEVMWIYDSDKLGYQDFYQKEHSYIYEAIQQLRMARKTIDVVTVSDQLSKNGNLDVIGGVDYLYDLSSFLFSTQPCSEYSKIVREKSLLRQVLKVCQGISGEVYEQKDTLQIFDAIEKKNPRVILLDPAGKQFDQAYAEDLAQEEELIFICGHYEGYDERI